MPKFSRSHVWGGAIYKIPINTIRGQKEPADFVSQFDFVHITGHK